MMAIVFGPKVCSGQDFAKTLMEEPMTIDGHEVVVAVRHLYFKSFTTQWIDGRTTLFNNISMIEVSLVWASGDHYAVWRSPASIPYEVPVEYRVLEPSEPLVDVELWKRIGGDKILLAVTTRGGAVVNEIDPHAPLRPIPIPPVFRQVRDINASGEVAWDPFSSKELWSYPAYLSPLMTVKYVDTDVRDAMHRCKLHVTWMGTVRVLADGPRVTLLVGLTASTYDAVKRSVVHRPLTEDDAPYLLNAPYHAQPVPERVWEEYRNHAAHHLRNRDR